MRIKAIGVWLTVAALALIAGCGESTTLVTESVRRAGQAAEAGEAVRSPVRRGVPVAKVTGEPVVRVRVASGLDRAELGSAGGVGGAGDGVLRVAPAGGGEAMAEVMPPVTVSRVGDVFTFHGSDGSLLVMTAGARGLRISGPGDVTLDRRRYPGTLVLRAAAGDDTRLDVVNHVGLEAYLPGVLERELYASWPAAAFEAQAVAARSYAIWERAMQSARDPQRGWDLEGDVASQAYAGTASNPRAIDAARQTRGIVLVYDDRVLPAFYSSACGGRGQDAAAVFADRVDDLPPLRGGARATCCEASPRFSWRAQRDAATLATRLAAWGRAHRHPVAGLRGLSAVTVAGRNAAGRPTAYHVTDAAGQGYTLNTEQFRFACNFDGSGASPLDASLRLPSGLVEPRVRAGRVLFDPGGGYGHGVGLCQWGTRARAAGGDHYVDITRTYYPGAEPVRVYQ